MNETPLGFDADRFPLTQKDSAHITFDQNQYEALNMIIDEEVVLSIAELAQLEILPEHMQEYVDSLSNILDLVEEMQSVDTDGVEPMSNPLDGVQRLRADKVSEVNQRDQLQEFAPETLHGLYLVPRVVE
ncbi:MAG: Asp-tRNA(Asn)/Glu-tRNA(Gln) amidotransferase subunit GatC [bacterium]